MRGLWKTRLRQRPIGIKNSTDFGCSVYMLRMNTHRATTTLRGKVIKHQLKLCGVVLVRRTIYAKINDPSSMTTIRPRC